MARQIEQSPLTTPEIYIKRIKGTLLAGFAATSIQACGPESRIATPDTTFGSTTATDQKENRGQMNPNITIVEEELNPIITIGVATDTVSKTEEATKSEKPTLTVRWGDEMPGQASVSAELFPRPTPVTIETPRDIKTLKERIEELEKTIPDERIEENGRTIEVFHTPEGIIDVKQTIAKTWNGNSASVLFYDTMKNYLAQNGVSFTQRAHYEIGSEHPIQELKFDKGKSTAVVRSIYVSYDPSKVRILTVPYDLENSLYNLSGQDIIDIVQKRDDVQEHTGRRIGNIGAYVMDTNAFLQRFFELSSYINDRGAYLIGYQKDKKFRTERNGDPSEIDTAGVLD